MDWSEDRRMKIARTRPHKSHIHSETAFYSAAKLFVLLKDFRIRTTMCSDVFCSTLLFTDRVSGKGTAIGRVRLSVRLFPLYLLNQLILKLMFVCVEWVMIIARLGLKVKVIMSRSKVSDQRVWAW